MSKYYYEQLKSGTKLYYAKNNISKTTTIEVLFDCGSRCDTIPGLAHLTEHLFFTGTKDMTKQEISKKYFDFINTNAYTSYREIAFTGKVFTKELGDYLSLVAKMITETTFAQKNIDEEVKVVQQEIARYRDRYEYVAEDLNAFYMTDFDAFQYGNLGTNQSVASVKTKDVKAFVKKYFVANNMRIYVSSPLGVGEIKKILNKNLISKLAVDEKFQQLPLFYFEAKHPTFYKRISKDIGKSYIRINFAFDKSKLDVVYQSKMRILFNMVNDSAEGIMKDMRLKKSLVYGGGVRSTATDKTTVATFDTECDAKNIRAVVETLAEYIKNTAEKGLTESQLKQAKRYISYSDANAEPRVNQLMNKLFSHKYYNRFLNDKKTKKEQKRTTLDEINQMFKEVFVDSKVSMFVYGDAKKDDLPTKVEFNKLFNKNN